MGIGDLSGKISKSDLDTVRGKNNPSEFEDGFGDDAFEDDDGGFDGMFDDLDDGFGSFGEAVGGGASDPFASFGESASDPFASFGESGLGNNGGLGGLGGASGIGGGAVERKPDTFDKVIEVSGIAAKHTGKVLLQMCKSVKNRNSDDWAVLSKNIIIVGGVYTLGSVALSLIGLFGGIKVLHFTAFPINITTMGLMTLGAGFIGLGSAALRIIASGGITDEASLGEFSELEDFSSDMDDDDDDDSDFGLFDDDDGTDDIMSELFGEDDGMSSMADYTVDKYKTEKVEVVPEVDMSKISDMVKSNVPMLTREYLFNTFSSAFPINTPGFSESHNIDEETSEFSTLEVLSLKALAAAFKKSVDDITSHLESAEDTHFSYILKLSRITGLTKLEDIQKEFVNYFRSSVTDDSVTAKVDLDGDFYKIILSKGTKAIVTFGDCFKLESVREFFLNTKNRLPFIGGIDDYGSPILLDGKGYPTMLIAGKPRSGKSWYVNSVLMPFMTFNTPEDVQLLIIDPKESNLFKTLSLMPHVCGIHNDKDIMRIVKDVIENEGSRRKKLLADNRVDDIWALRDRGIMLPVLYIVIDEVMTVMGNLGALSKDFELLLTTVITQLPSQGISLILVPHRAVGVVSTSARQNIAYNAAVRTDVSTTAEVVGDKSWKRTLVEPGDTALSLIDSKAPLFVKGVAMTTSDNDNTKLIANIAKAFYKMGVDIPDMRSVGCGYNRNKEHIIKELELATGNSKEQFNLDDVSDVDLNSWES